MHYLIGLAIIALANQTFTLLPSYHIQGQFNVVDVGNVLMWIALGVLLLRSNKIGDLFNPIGFFVIAYFIMVAINVTNATLNYDQGIKDGLIRSRHQFYYLSYFYFMLAFQTEKKMARFLDVLSWAAVILLLLAFINYVFPVVFHHQQFGAGHGERGGIKRAYIPGMDLFGLALVWQLTKYLHAPRGKLIAGAGAIIMVAGLLFRQTRGRIIAATLASGWMLVRAGRLKLILAAIVVGALGIGIMQFFLPENLLVDSYTSAYSDITREEGTWRGRKEQLEDSWNTFLEHPLFGSGALFIRTTEGEGVSSDLASAAYQSDLGWPHWIKDYGLMGIAWMLGLMLLVFARKRRVLRRDRDDLLTTFAWYQWLHLLLGMATIGYFFRAHGITIVCLVLAILTRTLFVGWHSSTTPASERSHSRNRMVPEESDPVSSSP